MLPCDVNPEREMRQRFFKREADMREAKVRITSETKRYTLGLVFRVINQAEENAAVKAFEKSRPRSKDLPNSLRVIDNMQFSAVAHIGGVKNEAEAIKLAGKILDSVGIRECCEMERLPDLHEAKTKVSTKVEPVWSIEVQFDKEDMIIAPGTTHSVRDSFMRALHRSMVATEDVKRGTVEVTIRAKSGKEAVKIIQGFIRFAEKASKAK